jgi:RHS repeat-associated protein
VGQTIEFNFYGVMPPNSNLTGSLANIVIQGARVAWFGVWGGVYNGTLLHLIDVDGQLYGAATYDAQRRLTQFYDKLGAVTNYAYSYGKTIKHIDLPAVTINNVPGVQPRIQFRESYSDLLRASSAGQGYDLAHRIPADSVDTRAAITDPRGYATYLTTNRFGLATKVEAPLIPAAIAEYDTLTGQLTRSKSPTGHVVRLTWNGNKLVTQNDSTLGKVDSLWYASQYSLPAAIKSTDGEQWFWYDSLKTGWPLKKSAPTGQGPFTLYYPDSFGRDSVIEDPATPTHRTSYGYASSGLRNRMSVTAPNQQTSAVGRNVWGIVQSGSAPNGASWTSALDVLNRPGWVAGQYGDTTAYQYDGMDRITVVRDAKGQVDSLKRASLGWVYEHVHSAGGADVAAYDSAGNVVYTRSRAGREVRYYYDALGRLSKRIGLATQGEDSLWYDPNGKWVATRAKVAGTLRSADTLETNEQSRKVTAYTTRPNSGSWRVESAFSASDPGRSSVILYKRVNGGDSTAMYTYYQYWDAQKRLTGMMSTSDTTNFFYSGESLIDSVSLRPGLTEKYSYTSSHELATRGYTGASWVDAPLSRWYRTDSLARIAERGDATSQFQTFGYDSLGRLRSWAKKTQNAGVTCVNTGGYGYTCSGTPPTVNQLVSPAYDKVGNPADAATVVTAGNRLTSFNGVTMTYDPDGYMISRVTSTTTDSLTWDEFGRLTSVKRVGQPQPTKFAYDGFGRRIRKTSPSSGNREYLWDGDQIIAEIDVNGSSNPIAKTYTYYPGVDQPRTVTTGGQAYFFSTESDGTVNALIRKSDRTVVAQYKYTPWGELEVDSTNVASDLRWKGLLYDRETELYYMRARYYDPKSRRFISEDPIGLEGGINVYAFAGGDAVNGSDPSGLSEDCDMQWIKAASIGYGELTAELAGYWVRTCIEKSEHTYTNHVNTDHAGDARWHGSGGGTSWTTQPSLMTREEVREWGLGFTGVAGGPRAAARLTTSQAADLAVWLGYAKRVKDAPFFSKGQAVFTDGMNFITQDIDMHAGIQATWKVFDRYGSRIGTYTYDLLTRLGK